MKIAAFEELHAAAGWDTYSFLKHDRYRPLPVPAAHGGRRE